MAKDERTLAALPDPRVRELLARVHREADGETPGLLLRFLDQLPRLAVGRAIRGRGPATASTTSSSAWTAARASSATCWLALRLLRGRPSRGAA